MNLSLIILGLVALTGAALAENSYLIIMPKLLKVGYDNQVSVFIAAASQPVDIKFNLTVGRQHIESRTTCKSGETRNVTLTLPREFPIGAGELIITGTGGLQFEEKRDVVIYDNRHVILVQTSSSSYRLGDTMEVRVVVTNENLIPMEQGELTLEVYDAALNLVSEFRRVPVVSGLTETIQIPIAKHVIMGSWLVSATIENSTSSVEVLVSLPITPSFDLKALFPRFLLRTDKMLRGSIEIDNDESRPIFGRATVAIGQITEQEVESQMTNMGPKPMEKKQNEEWRQWKSQQMEIAGRVELNYDLLSLFNIDVTKALAIQVHIQVTDLVSGQERVIRHIIPIFTRDIVYDIRPLQFSAGIKNEFEIIARRPDGKPIKMENMIVTVRMMMGDDQGRRQNEKSVEIKDFYTRGRNDIGLFNIEIPENCIGVLMTLTPLSEDGKMRGYRTQAVPLMPLPRRRDASGAKLSIELLPSTAAPANTDANVPVISSQISTVGRTSNFYVQLIPSKPVEKLEPLPMSYLLMTNGRITLTGEFHVEPTKECRSKTVREIRPQEQRPPSCVFNGTLPIKITRDMVPYSTLLVYTFQPSFGFHVIDSYRFSVAGLFQSSLTLNATVVQVTPNETTVENRHLMEEWNVQPIRIPTKVQDKTRVELSFTGTPDSTVGLNVFEYDGVFQGLSDDMTKERLLKYLTSYERVPFVSMPTLPAGARPDMRGPKVERHTRQVAPGMGQPGMGQPGMGQPGMGQPGMGQPGMGQPGMGQPGMGQPGMGQPGMGQPGMGMGQPSMALRTIIEKDEENLINRERMGSKVRYPIEKMFFGVGSSHSLPPVEGDDIYTTSNMGQLYGDAETRPQASAHYRRKLEKSINQYDVTVGNNDYVMTSSVPLVLTGKAPSGPMPPKPNPQGHEHGELNPDHLSTEEQPKYGTPAWYEKVNSKLSAFSQEAFTFMHSGLTVVSDFDTLRIPTDLKHENLTKIFSRFYERSTQAVDGQSFGVRDEARQLLREYISQSDLSVVPPVVMLEEASRVSYYRSIYFNTSRIESQGTGKVVLPQTKPYSTWVATGFALNAKSGLSVAQPVRLPTNQGLFVLADCPRHVRVGENVLLTYGINNYLGKDLSNVILRIRPSADFELMKESKPEQVVSSKDKEYTHTIPSLKSLGAVTHHMILVPKRSGLIQIVLEVESQFGGDYEVLTIFACESGIQRKELQTRLFDLTGDKKSYDPVVVKLNESSVLRGVRFAVSGTGLDRLVKRYTLETNALVGVDRAIVRLYRALGLRRYLNETSQRESPLFNITADNITTAYEKLQLYSDYNGSYSIISNEGTPSSSLYLTSLAFGAMISPMMPFRDNVTLNRTLSWILSRQQEDGSFDDNGPCFHYRFCADKFRREALTAIVLYSLTHDNASLHMPECIHRRLFDGANSPISRAQQYLVSRVPEVLPHLLPISLFEMAFIQNPNISSTLREKIHQALLSRKLTVVPEDGSKHIEVKDNNMSLDDQLLLNSMTLSLYGYFGDFRTVSDIARWVVSEIETHPHYDTVLDAVFRTEAWLKTDCLFRRQFGTDKVAVTVDVSADNGEKRQFTINSTNMDVTQHFRFALPVHQITYSVRGFGLVGVAICEMFVDQEQRLTEPVPFELTNDWTPMPWLTEIKTKTCMTYKPTAKDLQLAKENFNRTMVMKINLPSGMRVNERQLSFFFSRVPEIMSFTYEPCGHKINIFINVPSTLFGKPICFEWCIERLSTVMKWAPMEIQVFDYLQQDRQLARLFPVQFQPSLLGYSFIDAAHNARPSLESLPSMHKRTEM